MYSSLIQGTCIHCQTFNQTHVVFTQVEIILYYSALFAWVAGIKQETQVSVMCLCVVSVIPLGCTGLL